METYSPTNDFDFTKVSLDDPQPVQGGSYFTKLTIDKNNLHLQLPKCVTKQGIVQTKKNTYCDLLYDKDNQDDLVDWILSLEETCRKLIYKKRDLWFSNDFTEDDIETLTSPVFRLHSSGKKLLVRTYIDVNRNTGNPRCFAYDENEVQIELKNITTDINIIPLVLIDGIKFSSKSFDIVIKLTQIMTLEKEGQHNCLIKHGSNNVKNDNKGNQQILLSVVDSETLDESSSNLASKDSVVSEPAETEPAETEPVETEPVETEPAETEPVETEPVETEPAETEPVETESAETESAETESAEMSKFSNESLEESSYEVNKEQKDEVKKALDESVLSNLEEVTVSVPDGEIMTLRKPDDIYYELYKNTRERAKQMRRASIEAFLESKNIKTKYMLENIDNDDSDDDSVGSILENITKV